MKQKGVVVVVQARRRPVPKDDKVLFRSKISPGYLVLSFFRLGQSKEGVSPRRFCREWKVEELKESDGRSTLICS